MRHVIGKIYGIVAVAALVLSFVAPQTTKAVTVDDSFTQILEPQKTAVSSGGRLFVRGFVYPIAELGNCSSKGACFEYCEQMANVSACAAFSERHGIMKPGMAQSVDRLVQALVTGNRPGPCNTINDCITYCYQTGSHSDCVAYVQKLGLNQAVLGASDTASVQLPRGLLDYCDTTASCAAYCASSANSACAGFSAQSYASSGTVINSDIQKLLADSNNYLTGSSTSTSSSVTPRVKSVSSIGAEDINGELQNCLGTAQNNIALIQPVPNTSNPGGRQYDLNSYQQQNSQCVQDANNSVPTISEIQENSQAGTIQNVTSIQDCLANVKNFALEYKRCLAQ